MKNKIPETEKIPVTCGTNTRFNSVIGIISILTGTIILFFLYSKF